MSFTSKASRSPASTIAPNLLGAMDSGLKIPSMIDLHILMPTITPTSVGLSYTNTCSNTPGVTSLVASFLYERFDTTNTQSDAIRVH